MRPPRLWQINTSGLFLAWRKWSETFRKTWGASHRHPCPLVSHMSQQIRGMVVNPHEASFCHGCYVRIIAKCHYSAFLQFVTKFARPEELRFIVFKCVLGVSIKPMDKNYTVKGQQTFTDMELWQDSS